MEPEKPFACSMPDCGMTFTNEDHLHVHTKKHDMVLQLGMGQKAVFVADQTPTPTRFIRNCEEVGLFQDLQNVAVNPFDEGFKRAMETKQCLLTLEGPSSSEDVLHTPHLVFPIDSGDCTLYTANNQRNITISRSSSDESGKEYETTKISKLTNEVTTISRIIGKDDTSTVKHDELNKNKDILNETSVSYTNNVIIHSNLEIRQGIDIKKVSNNTDSVIKEPISIEEFVKLSDNNKLKEAPPIMSQKSLDFVVDSLTTDVMNREDSLNKNLKRNVDSNDGLNEKVSPKRNLNNKTTVTNEKDKNVDDFIDNHDYEVVIKLPNGKQMKMKAVDETEKPMNVKEKLNNTLVNKMQKPAIPITSPIVQNIVPIATGTLIPVTLMNPSLTVNPNLMNYGFQVVQKVPIPPLTSTMQKNFKSVKRKNVNSGDKCNMNDANVNKCEETEVNVNKKVLQKEIENSSEKGRMKTSHCAASKRYRARLKESMHTQREELKNLREMNRKLSEEKAVLQMIITQHLKDCPHGQELSRTLQEKLQRINNCIYIED